MSEQKSTSKSDSAREFTDEQREALQIDAATGGDLPLIGAVGAIGRISVKSAPELWAAAKTALSHTYTALRGGDGVIAIKEGLKASRNVASNVAEIEARPIAEVLEQARAEGKVLPKAGKPADYRGADEFLYNQDDLRKVVPADEFRQMAKDALAAEKAYRDTLSPIARWARTFKYDNANHDVGFGIGISRYGGSSMTHLKVAAADTELGEVGHMLLNNLRGTGQVVGLAVTAAVVAIKAAGAEELATPTPGGPGKTDVPKLTSLQDVHAYVAEQANKQGLQVQTEVPAQEASHSR